MKESKGVYVQLPICTMSLEQHVLLEITKALVSANPKMGLEYSWRSESIIERAKKISDEVIKEFGKSKK